MHVRARMRLHHRSQEEKGAVSTLLDCANTTLLKHPTINEHEAICPWVEH